MTTNISTISKLALGAGHVIEDENPVPIPHRDNITSKPVDEEDDNKEVNPESTD